MDTYKETGIYGEDDVFVLKSLKDFDEYEKILLEKGIQPDSNFYSFKEDFKKYFGKIWQNKTVISYVLNGVNIYPEYKIIGIEDNYAMMDWYWIVQNIDDDLDIKYILANSCDIEEGLKIDKES